MEELGTGMGKLDEVNVRSEKARIESQASNAKKGRKANSQLFATTSKGALHILYSPHSSTHGALLPLSKLPKSGPRDPGYSSADIQPVIFNPDALPQFADQKYGESLHQRDKRAKRMKPMEPVQGVGKGGRLGASAMQGLVHSLYPNEVRFEDPREALLRFADKEKEGEGEGEGGEE